MGDRINCVSAGANNIILADADHYSQRFGLTSHVYSFSSNAADALSRVVDGKNSSAAFVLDERLSSVVQWLDKNNAVVKTIGWLLTFITGGTIITSVILTRRVQSMQRADAPGRRIDVMESPTAAARRNIFDTLEGGVAGESLTAVDRGLDTRGHIETARLANARKGMEAAEKAREALERAKKDAGKGRKK